MLMVRYLRWTTLNVGHIARHNVIPQEVEQVCHNNPIVYQTYSGRLRLIGITDVERLLTIILAPEEDNTYFPVTARPSSRKERKLWRVNKGGEN